jgi:hypothetical protein
MDGSQHKGQITIKIPNVGPGQFVAQSYPQQLNVRHSQQQVVHQGQIHLNHQVPYHLSNQSLQGHLLIQGNPLNQQQIIINSNKVYAQPHQSISINQQQMRQIIYTPHTLPYAANRQ